MTRIAKKMLLGFVLAVAAAAPAAAAPIPAGYARIFDDSGSVPVTYNAAADVLSVTAPAHGEVFLPDCNDPSGFCFGGAISGFQTLLMNVDAQGHSSGGVYSFFGTDPYLGINTPRLLLAGAVTGVSVDAFASGPSSIPNVTLATMFLNIDMNTVYADPLLGNWGRQMTFGGFVFGNFATPQLTRDTLFGLNWALAGPADYWDLHARNLVPEPAALALLGLGLAVAAGAARKRRSATRSVA